MKITDDDVPISEVVEGATVSVFTVGDTVQLDKESVIRD